MGANRLPRRMHEWSCSTDKQLRQQGRVRGPVPHPSSATSHPPPDCRRSLPATGVGAAMDNAVIAGALSAPPTGLPPSAMGPGGRCSTGMTRQCAGNWRGSRATKNGSPVAAYSPPSRRSTQLAGIAVHVACRVCETAQPCEMLVSRTVVDLVAGSGTTSATAASTNSKAYLPHGDSSWSPPEATGVRGQWPSRAIDTDCPLRAVTARRILGTEDTQCEIGRYLFRGETARSHAPSSRCITAVVERRRAARWRTVRVLPRRRSGRPCRAR